MTDTTVYVPARLTGSPERRYDEANRQIIARNLATDLGLHWRLVLHEKTIDLEISGEGEKIVQLLEALILCSYHGLVVNVHPRDNATLLPLSQDFSLTNYLGDDMILTPGELIHDQYSPQKLYALVDEINRIMVSRVEQLVATGEIVFSLTRSFDYLTIEYLVERCRHYGWSLTIYSYTQVDGAHAERLTLKPLVSLGTTMFEEEETL